jgi:hypothetical protein
MGDDASDLTILCKIHHFGAMPPVAGVEFDHHAVHAGKHPIKREGEIGYFLQRALL